ncbi:unnamed protein product [Echinostoma caproni]|uniref:Late endosomal/lysosomal adaptor and MAPK and MTOR activator 4 n=1 Tax=Echinostoma caproni TaxID=27848 RepID=A0A183B322_9TREM|nr:unnamed protein product [Echinostoma caproni]
MSHNSSGPPLTPLAALNRLPGWLGTLVISPDGSVLQSAGDLVSNHGAAQRFAAMANRIGRLMNLESHRQTTEFKRLTIHFDHCCYIMTCVGDTIYVVKRLPDETDLTLKSGIPSSDGVPQ